MRKVNHLTILIFSMLTGSLAFSQNQYFNFYAWTNGATTGTLTSDADQTEFTSYTGCMTASVTITNSGGAWYSGAPKWTNSGSTFSMSLNTDWTTTSQTITMTLDLKRADNGNLVDVPVQFRIFDVNAGACSLTNTATDLSNRFIDVVNVKGYKKSTNTTINTSTIYNPNTMTNVGTGNSISGYTITGSGSGTGYQLGSTVTFTTGVSRIVITYSSGTGNPPGCATLANGWPLISGSNPRRQEIVISPILITVPNCTVLPVSLTDFTSECDNLQKSLRWTTASEVNNDYFDISGFNNEYEFVEIGRVNGSGTTNMFTSYKFPLTSNSEDYEYYQLSQTDLNGDKEILSTISSFFQCNQSSEDPLIFPNPSNGQLNIRFPDIENRKYFVKMYDAIGREVYHTEIIIGEENSTFSFPDLSGLSNGVYGISVINDQYRWNSKWIKE